PVRIDTFSNSYFPPGCTAEGIRFLRHKHPEVPIITVQKLVIQGSFTGLFSTPKRLNAVRVVGMHMIIPPKAPDDGKNNVALNAGPGGKSLAISKITADGTVLEFIRENRDLKPYILKIDRLGITEVGSGSPMFYRATLTNTEPPGVIRSEGKFGPWNPASVGDTQLSGENIFVVRDGKIHTPPLGASVLPGITRDAILTLAREAGIPVVESIIPRELLYIADEVFFSGTAAEITPIRSIDRITIGAGRRGPIAERLQKEFFGVINGTRVDTYGWLSPVHALVG